MTDLERLHREAIARPAEDLPRLLYADAVEERDRPGDAELAAFVRVQCKYARLGNYERACPFVGQGPQRWEVGNCSCQGRECVRRERELWPIVRDRFLDKGWGPVVCESAFARGQATTTAPLAIVRRGFIAEVRAPLATLVGDRGEEYETPDGEASWRILPAVLPAIAKSHPLEWAEAVGKRPQHQVIVAENQFWWDWPPPGGSADFAPHYLPPMLFEYLNADEWYPTEHAALAALSRALIAWARAQPLSSSPAQGCEVAVG